MPIEERQRLEYREARLRAVQSQNAEERAAIEAATPPRTMIGGVMLEQLSGENRAPWRDALFKRIMAKYGPLGKGISDEPVWKLTTARKRAHRFIDDGADREIVALFWARVGEPGGEQEASEVRSIVRRATEEPIDAAHAIADYARVFQIVLTFVYGEMRVIQAQQEAARAAVAPEKKRITFNKNARGETVSADIIGSAPTNGRGHP